jgi:Uma2 family endonuclease
METPPKPADTSVAGFLAWQNLQNDSYEFLNGDVVGVVRESPVHSTICANIAISLSNRLRGTPCRACRHGTQLIAGAGVLLPDVMMICARAAEGTHTVTEPLVVFEVMSGATEKRDRIIKNRVYRNIPSLRQYVMIAQDQMLVESMVRTDRGWLHDTASRPDSILSLPAHGLDFPLAEIYADTEALAKARRSN